MGFVIGHSTSLEIRAKMSAAGKGNKHAVGHLGSLSKLWRGGADVAARRVAARRRRLGFIPLNAWFVGCDGHHVDNEHVIYMPHKLHHSIYHRQSDGRGMAAINALAYDFLAKQEALSIPNEIH